MEFYPHPNQSFKGPEYNHNLRYYTNFLTDPKGTYDVKVRFEGYVGSLEDHAMHIEFKELVRYLGRW